MSSARPLIVGAFGQVGTALRKQLADSFPLISSSRPNEDSILLDLNEVACVPNAGAAMLEACRPSVVYCVGGMPNVEACEDEADRAHRINARGPAVLANAAYGLGVGFVYLSTEYVFDGAAGPYDEEATPNPISVYGRSKLDGERMVLASHPDALIVRTTVVYGVDPRRRNFLYGLLDNLEHGKRMRVPDDQISTPTYNEDVASAMIGLISRGARGVVHACGPDRVSRSRFALRTGEALGFGPELVVPTPTAALGQRAPRPLRAGLISATLASLLPDVTMRGIDAGIAAWIASGVRGATRT